MMKHLIFFTILALLGVVSTSEAKVNDCSGADAVAKLESVSVSGCDLDKDASCALVQGKTVTMNVEFTTASSFSSAKVDIRGKIAGFPLPFPVDPSEACGNYGFECPAKVGDKKTFSISLPIQKYYPRISALVQLKLTSEQGKPIICVEIPSKIVGQ